MRDALRMEWWTVIAVAAATAGVATMGTATATAQDATYMEPYRPQFHFTPEKNWMNDPNGMVYYDGEYHLFFQHNPFGNQWGHMSWGHAVSKDLVHWEELPVAIPEEGNEMIFSGSAVVDRLNTSGFGTVANPPMVAVYTSAVSGDQYQSVASSTDRGRTWVKRGKVLDDPDPEFRDPKVFWYAAEQKWVMVVVKAVQRKVAIYESRNLKDWTHLSDFGPANAVGGVWECPDLFPLMVDGDPTKTKWVMVVSLNPGSIAGGSGTQYFVGDFDGRKFTADNVKDYTPPTGDVYEDFESSTYSPWTTAGNAFGDQPATGNVPPQGGVSGYEGDRLANSFHEEDRGTGTLTSPPFTITRPALNFLIGGGNHPHDPATTDAPPPAGTVFADFEGGSYGPGWTATGTFENTKPAEGSLPGQMPVSGYEGRYLVNTFYDHDNGTGHITSPEFQITTDYINFLVGGGNHPYPGDAGNPPTAVNLVVGGRVVRTSTGQESEALNWTNWNVSQLKGQTARIDIVDENTGGWGHILADQFTFSDQPAFPRSSETAVNLLVDDQVVRTATGKDSERLDWAGWNVRSLIGKTARLQLVDRNTGGWGHILADQFMFSDVKAQSAEERADWLDYGKDYYAAVSWNDVPDGRRLMIGWANNWQYANQIPTSPWRSAMSVPRELALKTIDGKVQAVQQPVDELQRLRTGRPYHVADQPIVNTTRTVERCSGKALEIVAELAIGDARQTGLIVRAGDGEETVIGYDADTQEVYVDRTRSGRVDFSRNFPGVQRAPLEPRNGKVRLHVLVDWSLIEVYADQGQRVITDQVFPAGSSQELKVFATGGSARLEAMDVWTLRSIWNGESDAGRCAPRAEQANENPGGAPDRGPGAGHGPNRVFGRVASARAGTRCYSKAVLARGARAARRSMRFTYRLTAAAPVRLTVRRRNGSPAWTSCPPRRGKKPFRYTDIDTWNEGGRAGENRSDIGTAAGTARPRKVVVTRKWPHTRGTVSLDRMLQGKRLRAGTYVLAVASLDDTGRVTSERHVKFWVVNPRSSR